MEKPGRNKTNKTLPVSERADTPPTKNKITPRTTLITTGVYFGNCWWRRCIERVLL
jgi:hypothetical protein